MMPVDVSTVAVPLAGCVVIVTVDGDRATLLVSLFSTWMGVAVAVDAVGGIGRGDRGGGRGVGAR